VKGSRNQDLEDSSRNPAHALRGKDEEPEDQEKGKEELPAQTSGFENLSQ
jgi:hypothetical protein